MAESTDIDEVMTHLLVEAGDVLRTLKPSTIASFFFLVDETEYTQEEIGNRIGYSGATVSESHRSLEALPLPLATKHGRSYRATPAGETLISYLNGMADRLGVDLHSLDWQSEAAHEKVASLLTPLYDSRISIPFFVLHSIGTRSAEGDRIDRLSPLQQVWIGDVIQDVETRQQERGESSTSAQIRQVIRRFEDKGIIEVEGNQITLTEKGQEHAVLLERVVQLIEEQVYAGESDEEEKDTTPSETAARPDATENDQATSNERKHKSGSIAQQIQPQGFLGSRSSATDRVDTQEPFLLVPTYCLDFTNEAVNEGPRSQLQPVLPLTAQTTGELANRVEQLVQEHGEDAQLVLYWMLQTADGLYPLESVDGPISSANSPESEDA